MVITRAGVFTDVEVPLTSVIALAQASSQALSPVAASWLVSVNARYKLDERSENLPLSLCRLGPCSVRQAFLLGVAVATDGTTGVTYYDFGFNGSGSGLLTDYWLVQRHPTSKHPATDAAQLGQRGASGQILAFNLEAAFTVFGHFLRDYVALAGEAEGFAAVFTAVDHDNHTAIFSRRVEK